MAELMPRRMLVASLAAVLAGGAALSGCVVVVGGKGHYYHPEGWSDRDAIVETRTLTLEHEPGAALDIATDDGVIEVRRHSGSQVEIEARIRAATEDRLNAIGVSAERDGAGTLRIRPEWPNGVRKTWESCSFIVHLPDAGDLRLHSGDGAIRVYGVGADIRATTDDGSIELIDIEGAVDAETDDGAITLRQAAPGAPLRLITDDGSVRVELHPGFVGSIEATTHDGGIGFNGFDRLDALARFDTVTSERLRITAGEGGPSSTIRTDDGAVSITVRSDRAPN